MLIQRRYLFWKCAKSIFEAEFKIKLEIMRLRRRGTAILEVLIHYNIRVIAQMCILVWNARMSKRVLASLYVLFLFF